MTKVTLANMAAAVAALSAGGAVVATRAVVGELDPVTVAFYRYLIAAACLAPVLPFVWPRSGITVTDLGKIAALGVLFFGLFPWAFSAALQHTTAARGAIGLATLPMQTLLVAALFGREPLTRSKLLSVGLAFAGIAIAHGSEAARAPGSQHLIGDGLMLLAAFGAALYSVFSRRTLERCGPVFVTALGMIFGVAALLPLSVGAGAGAGLPLLSRDGWLGLLFLGTIGGAVQFVLFILALRWLSPTRTVIYLSLNPVSAMVLAVALLGESVTMSLALGLLLVLSGVSIANLPRSSQGPATADPTLARVREA